MSAVADRLTKWLAQWIEQSLAIGRAMGIAYPREYDVGMKILSRRDNVFVIRLRVDTTTREVTLRFPTDRDAQVHDVYMAAMTRARDDVASAATAIAHAWLDEHPNAYPTDARVATAVTLAEVDRRIAALPPPQYTRVR